MSDTLCQQCERENPVWWVDNDLWNEVMGTADNPRGEGIIVCPSCFTRRIQARLAEAEKERDAAFDAGIASVLDAIVCSVCGFNHDADESAACVGCEPIAFGEWTRMAQRRLALLENVAKAAREPASIGSGLRRLREALHALDGEGGAG